MRYVDNLELVRWREMDSIHVLRLLADHIKEDPSFHPRSSHLTTRWHAHVHAGMTKCSNYAHDKALIGGVAVPEPDELLADVMALDTWRDGIEKRSKITAQQRKM